MRERLIELLSDAEREHLNYEMANKFCPFDDYKCHSEYIADYLLENGVVALPCKVGDVVYATPLSDYELDDITKMTVEFTVIGLHRSWVSCVWQKNSAHFQFLFNSFGKTVFLTREEAERALKGGATE